MDIKRITTIVGLAVVCVTPAEAQFQAARFGGDPSYWLFTVAHTDPDTRLTQIDFTDLLPLYVTGFGYGFNYGFSFYFPTPVPGSTDAGQAGYLAQSYGWRFANATTTSFSLINEAGFQGTAGLYAFQWAVFCCDAFVWEGTPYAEGSIARSLAPSDLMGSASYTYVTPEPVTLLLFGSGLLGLGVLGRKKRTGGRAASRN